MSGTNLKDIFLTEVEQSTNMVKNVAVALSSGIDSTAIMFALLELKKHVRAYTFHVEGVVSQDLTHARANAETFGVELVECVIPRGVHLQGVFRLIDKYRLKKKTDIECVYPFLYLLPKVKEVLMLTGHGADKHFCISKRAMIHFRHTLEKMNEFRNDTEADIYQRTVLGEIALNEWIVKVYSPFPEPEMVKYFSTKTWDEINRPKQKQTLTDMFPDQFAKIKRFNHTNLQCGDSMIREVFEPMLDDVILNKNKRTRMVDLYRDLFLAFHPKKGSKNGKGQSCSQREMEI